MNNQISKEKMTGRNISFSNEDWDYTENLSKNLGFRGISAIFRAFLRMHQKNPNLYNKILYEILLENDRIQSVSKRQKIINRMKQNRENLGIPIPLPFWEDEKLEDKE